MINIEKLPHHLVLSAMFLTFGLTGCHTVTSLTNSISNQSKPSIVTGIEHTNSQYADKRFLTIAGKDYPVSETSARLLTNSSGTAPELVADIYSGKADKEVPGYKIMIINRTSSLLAEGRKRDNGTIIDNRMIHRGSKALIGIPVINGKAQLSQAVLLKLDVIYDDPNQMLADGEVVKPRGQRLTKKDTPVSDKKLQISALTLPNIVSGESSGGGIVFKASALIDGQMVTTGANSTFKIFDTTTPDKARGF